MTTLPHLIEALEKAKEGSAELDFGDYCFIEQKRHGAPNEQYIHKVIGRLQSNSYVDVPVQSPAKETSHPGGMADVVRCIVCGVSEDRVLKYRIADVQPAALRARQEEGS